MAKAGLKGMLDQYRGRNIRLEKQRKKEKEAEKRRQDPNRKPDERPKVDADGFGDVPLDQDVQRTNKTPKKEKFARKKQPPNASLVNEVKNLAPGKAEQDWETDDSEEEDDEDDESGEDRAVVDFSRLNDSDSEGSFDDDDEEEDEDEEEDPEADIAFSDIESLASEDRADVVPYQRLTINNTTALTAALNRISLPYSKLTFSEHQSVTSKEPIEIEDVEDDLARELAFYKQSLAAVNEARAKLKKEGVPFSRPVDYFAEMVKSDEHMGKIKDKLINDAAGKKAAAEARRQRDLKKFGKQVQVAKLQDRSKEKRDTLEKINLLKRKRAGADVTTTHEEDLFDVELDAAATTKGKGDKKAKDGKGREPRDGDRNHKRAKKDQKYGFGGKKRHGKSNDAESTNDGRDFSMNKMKGKPSGGGKRLGKSRRSKM